MWELSETERMVEQMIRSFAEREIAPRLRELESGKLLPYELLRRFAETTGLTDQVSGEPNAGKSGQPGGIDPMIPAILFKELSRVSPGLCMAMVASLGCAMAIVGEGSAEQRKRYARSLLSFEKIGCWALTEHSSGSDAFGSMRTRARQEGDEWIISGGKTFISNAPYADVFLVYARVGDAVRAFVLERGDAGLTTGPAMEKMGMWDSPTGEIFLDEVRVGADRLLGRPPGANRSSSGEPREARGSEAKSTLRHERAVMPAMCLGIIERCVEESVRYAAERQAFGKAIGEFQLIGAKLARMHVALNNARNLVAEVVEQQRRGQLGDKLACTAKLYCSEQAVQAGLDAIQIMGGAGYMREAPVEKLMRDAKMLEIGGGTSEIQIVTIARALLREAQS